jgi:hypothetical protein
MRTFRKDPDETLILDSEWDRRVVVSTSSWIVESGIVSEGSIIFGQPVLTVSGGTLGEQYKCTNRVETHEGETLERSFFVQVVEK